MATKISDKLKRVSDGYTVSIYDNGFMLEISGRDHHDEYRTTKLLANNIDDLVELVREAASLPRD